ncbi:MAG: hypothetical protein ACE5JI_14750, partial [Acidobacteriota bacterium]
MKDTGKPLELLHPTDAFVDRHIGPTDADIEAMLGVLGAGSLDGLMQETVPENIRRQEPLALPDSCGEHELLGELRTLAGRNQVFRSFIGMGYH